MRPLISLVRRKPKPALQVRLTKGIEYALAVALLSVGLSTASNSAADATRWV
jgi:hypothetical protein